MNREKLEKLKEIRNIYTFPNSTLHKLTFEQTLLIKYDDLCIELIEENQELKQQYCERTDCAGRIGNSKKVEKLLHENEQLKAIINEAIDYIKKGYLVNTKDLLSILKGVKE